MEQTPPAKDSRFVIWAARCREAMASPHWELERRQTLVLEQLIRFSFDLDRVEAPIGSNDQLALLTGLDKASVSHALRSLRQMRAIQAERGGPLRHFRQPMVYTVLPDDVRRLGAAPQVRESGLLQRTRDLTVAWLIDASRLHPLQPDLIPPDPRALELALAEISRTSALAAYPTQNAEPKPGSESTREAYPAEHGQRQGDGSARPGNGPKPAPKEPGGEPGPVVEFSTGGPNQAPSCKIYNYLARTRQMVPDGMEDGENNSPSANHPEGDARGPVEIFSTDGDEAGGDFVAEASALLRRYGEEWRPPSAAQEVFGELCRCMDTVMGNYRGWWWPKCAEGRTRRAVVEAIATWKLARHHPKHKPWGGGAWKQEYRRRLKALQEADAARPMPAAVPPATPQQEGQLAARVREELTAKFAPQSAVFAGPEVATPTRPGIHTEKP